jgi:hypothetical protein
MGLILFTSPAALRKPGPLDNVIYWVFYFLRFPDIVLGFAVWLTLMVSYFLSRLLERLHVVTEEAEERFISALETIVIASVWPYLFWKGLQSLREQKMFLKLMPPDSRMFMYGQEVSRN